MFTCRVFSCVVGRGCLLWPVCSLGKILLAVALLHFVLQSQVCLLLQVSLDFLLLSSGYSNFPRGVVTKLGHKSIPLEKHVQQSIVKHWDMLFPACGDVYTGSHSLWGAACFLHEWECVWVLLCISYNRVSYWSNENRFWYSEWFLTYFSVEI